MADLSPQQIIDGLCARMERRFDDFAQEHGCTNWMLDRAAVSLLERQQQENKRLTFIVESKQREIDRLAICPDHCGKAGGERCYVCKAEESVRREMQDAVTQGAREIRRLEKALAEAQAEIAAMEREFKAIRQITGAPSVSSRPLSSFVLDLANGRSITLTNQPVSE